MRANRTAKRSGYLVAILSICVAAITVAYLILATRAASKQDEIELSRVQTAAYYASESGLISAENRLKTLAGQSPKQGEWILGELPTAGSKFRVEVKSEAYTATSFTLISRGQATGERNRVHSCEFEARFKFVKAKGWIAQWRVKV